MRMEELINSSKELGVILSDTMVQQLKQYAVLLKEWNEKMNLTSITEPEEVYEKHFYDSILPLQESFTGKIADVGTGAGFPGLVWKIVKPEYDVTLIEPTGKRCNFLKAVIEELGLQGITVVNERAEDYAAKHRETFDVVTARAVANLSVLSELCVPLLKKGGLFVAMKGMHGDEESEKAVHAMKELGASLEKQVSCALPSGDTRVNLYYRKTAATPSKYPRNYGQIKKKPL